MTTSGPCFPDTLARVNFPPEYDPALHWRGGPFQGHPLSTAVYLTAPGSALQCLCNLQGSVSHISPCPHAQRQELLQPPPPHPKALLFQIQPPQCCLFLAQKYAVFPPAVLVPTCWGNIAMLINEEAVGRLPG